MTRQYFGTDGIRGRVGESPITPAFMLHLGMAAGRILAQRWRSPAVLIGKDTRISGYMLEAALESGFSSVGVDVMLAGPMPTPAIAYLTRTLRLSAGVVISASHNPYDDNGIKFFDHQGEKLPDSVELEIEAALAQEIACVASRDLGKARRIDDAAGRYIEFCKSSFPQSLSLSGLRLVVDAAHGAAYHVAADVFHELGAEVIRMGHQPDGLNINHQVGATHPEAMANMVLAAEADYGIALDGDGDRIMMADASGRIFSGDELLYAIVKHRVSKRGKVAVGGVVGTLMTNLALEHRLGAMGLDFRRAKVGDRYVMETLKETGWQLGGETSGHLLCLDRHTTGDGIISALQVLAAVVGQEQTLSDYVAELQLLPQVLVNRRLPPGFDWQAHATFQSAYQRAKQSLQGQGRILIRPSGTEPLLRIMVEHESAAAAADMAEGLAAELPDQ
ncbi:{ManB} Phosphomannomutase [Burkholderiales bacterium]